MLMFAFGFFLGVFVFYDLLICGGFMNRLRNDTPKISLEEYLALSEKDPDKWALLSWGGDIAKDVHEIISGDILYFPDGFEPIPVLADFIGDRSYGIFSRHNRSAAHSEKYITFRLSLYDLFRLKISRLKESIEIDKIEKNERFERAYQAIHQCMDEHNEKQTTEHSQRQEMNDEEDVVSLEEDEENGEDTASSEEE